MIEHFRDYSLRLTQALTLQSISAIPELVTAFRSAWESRNTIFLCGNGGSARNTIHLANDFLYGTGVKCGVGLRVEALSANSAVLICLANDIGYGSIFRNNYV